MNYELLRATIEEKEIIKNLMQFYIYDFSEFVKCDVEEDGLFGAYPYLDEYWEEVNQRFPYVIKQDKKYAGFVLVRFIESEERNYFSIAEFFIMKKYRKEGIGKAVAKQLFDLHKGDGEVYQLESNRPAQAFWNKTINEYTKGKFKERFENGRRIQDFSS
ncbi:GNAT family N-acetyltransferase [Paenibacillus sp. NPDC058177]|uniref:GNAT family N-acetyltransferase n=1 Tax=Paenibacillus sp. NPDC058177 TaxID=3346369 RepID=UPI0036D95E2D